MSLVCSHLHVPKFCSQWLHLCILATGCCEPPPPPPPKRYSASLMYLCVSDLPVFVLSVKLLQNSDALLLAVAGEVAPQDSVAELKVLKRPSDRVTGASNPDGLHHAGVLELVHDHLWGKLVADFLAVWLDAANKVGVGLTQRLHQGVQ